jgi:hypothetical protein
MPIVTRHAFVLSLLASTLAGCAVRSLLGPATSVGDEDVPEQSVEASVDVAQDVARQDVVFMDARVDSDAAAMDAVDVTGAMDVVAFFDAGSDRVDVFGERSDVPVMCTLDAFGIRFCPNGEPCCGGFCVDRMNDPSNCGGCGYSCPLGYPCIQGRCSPIPCGCPPGETCCPLTYQCAPPGGCG